MADTVNAPRTFTVERARAAFQRTQNIARRIYQPNSPLIQHLSATEQHRIKHDITEALQKRFRTLKAVLAGAVSAPKEFQNWRRSRLGNFVRKEKYDASNEAPPKSHHKLPPNQSINVSTTQMIAPGFHGGGMHGGMHGGGHGPIDRVLFKDAAEEAYSTSPKNALGDFHLVYSTPTLKFWQKSDLMLVGIRGTKDAADLVADGMIAVGALEKSPRFQEDLKTMEHVKRSYQNVTFYGAGHSLGAAILDLFIKKGFIKEGVSYNGALQIGQEEAGNTRVYNTGDALYQLSRPFLHQTPETRTQARRSVAEYLSPAYYMLKQHKTGLMGAGKYDVNTWEEILTFTRPKVGRKDNNRYKAETDREGDVMLGAMQDIEDYFEREQGQQEWAAIRAMKKTTPEERAEKRRQREERRRLSRERKEKNKRRVELQQRQREERRQERLQAQLAKLEERRQRLEMAEQQAATAAERQRTYEQGRLRKRREATAAREAAERQAIAHAEEVARKKEAEQFAKQQAELEAIRAGERERIEYAKQYNARQQALREQHRKGRTDYSDDEDYIRGRGSKASGWIQKLLSENMRWHYLHPDGKARRQQRNYPDLLGAHEYGWVGDTYESNDRDNEVPRGQPNYMTAQQVARLQPMNQGHPRNILNDRGPRNATQFDPYEHMNALKRSGWINVKFPRRPPAPRVQPARRAKRARGHGMPHDSGSESDDECDRGRMYHRGANRTIAMPTMHRHLQMRAADSDDDSDSDVLRPSRHMHGGMLAVRRMQQAGVRFPYASCAPTAVAFLSHFYPELSQHVYSAAQASHESLTKMIGDALHVQPFQVLFNADEYTRKSQAYRIMLEVAMNGYSGLITYIKDGGRGHVVAFVSNRTDNDTKNVHKKDEIVFFDPVQESGPMQAADPFYHAARKLNINRLNADNCTFENFAQLLQVPAGSITGIVLFPKRVSLTLGYAHISAVGAFTTQPPADTSHVRGSAAATSTMGLLSGDQSDAGAAMALQGLQAPQAQAPPPQAPEPGSAMDDGSFGIGEGKKHRRA